MTEGWVDIGSAEELARTPLKSCKAETIAIAISFKDGQFGAVSNVCNHVGGPLGEGRLDGDYITCPWHGWKFHCRTGVGEPGFEQDRVPAFREGRKRPGSRQRGTSSQRAAPATSALRKPERPRGRHVSLASPRP
jgi:nitrite reductase/ring-hydroxylating ferredoxin subunit